LCKICNPHSYTTDFKGFSYSLDCPDHTVRNIHDLAFIQQKIDKLLSEVGAGNDTRYREVIIVNIDLRNFTFKTWFHHRLLKRFQLLFQILPVTLIWFSSS
jgi:hypothetical protein